MLRVKKIAFKTAQYTLDFRQIEDLETKSMLLRLAEFWLVQYCFVAKGMSRLISSVNVGYVNTQDNHNSKRQHVYEAICSIDKG